MTYRLARSLDVLRSELNETLTLRDKSSDGWIGDAAHAARNSDHNPWIKDAQGVGVVRALDIDEDLDGNTADSGKDAEWLAEYLRALGKAGDPRLNGGGYVIYESRIAGGSKGWEWRPYTGPNGHKKHVHLSVSRDPAGYDSDRPWNLPVPGAAPPVPKEDDMPTTDEIVAALRPVIREEVRAEVGKAIGWVRAFAEALGHTGQRLADRAAHLNPARKK